MKWKPEVVVKKGRDYYLQRNNLAQPVPEKDVYLVEAMERGVTEDARLVRLIMAKEKIDETAAARGLTQFSLDYGDFIAENTPHEIITN